MAEPNRTRLAGLEFRLTRTGMDSEVFLHQATFAVEGGQGSPTYQCATQLTRNCEAIDCLQCRVRALMAARRAAAGNTGLLKVAPGLLLHELVRGGALEMRKDDMLVLRGNAFVPKVAEGGR